jgi:uncharacterized damage-inducible protein DinB
MATLSQPEVWLRGAVPGISPFLQPVAHVLMQAREEINALMQNFPDNLLWERPASVASPGFHLQHMVGVLDRLFTYAAGNQLTAEQLFYLKAEGSPHDATVTTVQLLAAFDKQVDRSLDGLKSLNEEKLTEERGVGRAQLPSTVLGLLFHSAEHTMRHTGQLLVTVKILTAKEKIQTS